jgi:hypothetical protein
MRSITMLMTLVLTGCQGISTLDQWMAQPVPSVMPFWETYQRCMTTTDPHVLIQSVEQLERAMLEGPDPPDWMKTWGGHVVRQPIRTAVDPRALGAACTLRVATVMVDAQRLLEARTFYHRVLAHYPDPQLVYYTDQAKDALVTLPADVPALIALRPTIDSLP